MPRTPRPWAVLAGLLAMLALATSTALAGGGGHAVTTIQSTIDGSGEPMAAGDEREIRFTLLERGVTPVESGAVRLTATLSGTRERVRVLATSVGGGDWVARVTFPVEGRWRIGVTHDSLGTPPPTALDVGPGPAAPWVFAVIVLGAVMMAGALLVAAVALARGGLPIAIPEPQPTG